MAGDEEEDGGGEEFAFGKAGAFFFCGDEGAEEVVAGAGASRRDEAGHVLAELGNRLLAAGIDLGREDELRIKAAGHLA